MLHAWVILACTDATAPAGGRITAGDVATPPAPPSAAAAQAARAAPTMATPWAGKWTLAVYAAPEPETLAGGAAALAAGLGVPVTAWTGGRPRTRPGEAAVLWLPSGADVNDAAEALRAAPGPQGEVVAVLAPGDAAWADRAAERLPWSGVAIVDPVSSARSWVDDSVGIDPALAGRLAANVIADHYGVPYVAGAGPYPPGLDARLGDFDVKMLASEDPRTRAEAVRAGARLRGTRADPYRVNPGLVGHAPPRPGPDALVADPVVAVRLAVAETTADPAVRLALSRDPEPLVRARAADGLDDIARLDALARDPSSVVRLVATARLGALAKARPAEVVGPLRAAAASSDAYQRWKAAWGLGLVPGTSDALVPLLRDPDIDVRREAARSLGRLRDPAAVDALLLALEDDNSFVRRWAAAALGDIGDARAKDALRRASKDPTSLVAQAAARSLTTLGEPTAAPPFTPPQKPRDDGEIGAWVASPDATIRKDACKFIAERSTGPLWLPQLVKDRDSEVRKSAVEAMGWRADDAASAIPFVVDPDPDVQITALEALRRGRAGTAAALAPLLAYADAEVRLRAAEALAALGPSDPLAALAADPDERIRAAAAAVYPDRIAADDPSVLVRRAAAKGGADPTAAAPSTPFGAWADGVFAREDDLLHLRFSWNEPSDRPDAYKALRPPVIRAYGHPDRG